MIRAVVTGSHGQDGTYLVRLLRERGYEVVAVDRNEVDLADPQAVSAMLRSTRPHELYNLAAPTSVPQSWDDPVEMARAGCVAVAAILDSVLATVPVPEVSLARP